MVIKRETDTADAVPSAMFPWIIDCGSWGARRPKPPGVVLLEGTTRKIILHHTGEPAHNTTDFSRERAVRLAKDIQRFHQDERGWSDSGQHFTVSRGGHVLEGRACSLETLETGLAQVRSAHCPGRNHDSIGIENEGFYIEETPTQKLWDSLVRLCVTICRQYQLRAHHIFGHWDFRNTQCPGIGFYRQFPQLRREVAAQLGTQIGEVPERTWPDIYEVAEGTPVGGPVVTVAQYLLRNAGYPVPLTDGGQWSPEMTSAIKDWQHRHGLAVSPDGTMTAGTWETLAPELDQHATGDVVRALQGILIAKGYLGVGVDGQFDDATESAVKDLQKLHGLPANGEVDTRTWCVVTGGVIREAFRDALHS
ncbi:peptidoglycan recognition protein family protein [Micromonospora sp. DT46]|uniref:peptidoglycan recognition protein family protein n=1 Tax=unclassified Micromonospora TaxID=2617518 RepID=UPI00124BA5A2|nr:peptidoglycan-binding protein [Micromonospora sp. AMSO12t]KAB1162324.1 N-acetylmuramoyl-L-alanine amidase [Micromonospora sp. AMSO12t]